MRASRPVCIAILSLLTLCVSSAQTPASTPPVLPPGPLIAKNAPNFASWTATTKAVSSAAESTEQGNDAKKQVPPRQLMQVIKTDDIRFIRIVDGKSTSERWCRGAVQIIKRPEWKEPMLSTGENRADAARLDFGGGDFGGFDWISELNFVGVRKVAGRDCLVFKDQIQLDKGNSERVFYDPHDKADAAGAKGSEKVLAVACVDLETRLPVALTVGDLTTSYVFGDPPPAMLTLPPECQQVLDKFNKQRQELLRKPSRP